MHAVKVRELVVDSTPEHLFASLLGVARDRGCTVFALNNEALKVAFASGRTAFSWGQEYVAHVEKRGERAVLTLACGTTSSAPKAMMDGWKNGRSVSKVLAVVESVLDDALPIPVERVESFTTREDGTTGPITMPGELA